MTGARLEVIFRSNNLLRHTSSSSSIPAGVPTECTHTNICCLPVEDSSMLLIAVASGLRVVVIAQTTRERSEIWPRRKKKEKQRWQRVSSMCKPASDWWDDMTIQAEYTHTHVLRDEEKVAARGKTTRYILCADRDWRLVTCLSKQLDIDEQMTTTTTTNHSSPIEVLLCVELASDRSNWKTFSQLAAMDEKREKGCVAINSIMHAALSLSLCLSSWLLFEMRNDIDCRSMKRASDDRNDWGENELHARHPCCKTPWSELAVAV